MQDDFKNYLMGKGFRQATIRIYLKHIDQISSHFDLSVFTSLAHIFKLIEWYRKKDNPPKMINQLLKVLEYYLDSLGVENNPCKSLRVKGEVRGQLYDLLDSEELDSIYQGYGSYGKVRTEKHHRNHVVLGLFIYQGLKGTQISELLVKDLNLSTGTIIVQSGVRSNKRKLFLKPFQILSLHEYVTVLRSGIIAAYGIEKSEYLFPGQTIVNLPARLIERINRYHSRAINLRELRASVITNWLKEYNVRQVQYMAGHKYVTTTESYKQEDLEQLQEGIKEYHPLDKGLLDKDI